LRSYGACPVVSHDPSKIEFILKIDPEDYVKFKPYISYLSENAIRYKILCYPKFEGYDSAYYFYDSMAWLASGHTIWALDVPVLKGDWLSVFSKARGVFDDNIYTINVIGNSVSRSRNGFLAISAEWLRFFGCFVPTFYGDKFVKTLGFRIGRIIHDRSIRFDHEGRKKKRKLSKRTVKKLTEEFVVKYVDKFNRRK